MSDKKVDNKDLAILANDYRKLRGQYVGDISDANGIPDGVVDNNDLSAFCGDWLKDVNDL